ncbi:transmembrane protein 14C-like [Physella acuta]|uniref:transmembrane protein 14C-like n=1 Tax=Physella acuta TaxID=109671 RepID=UPI0027DE3916|nr:transmembrane protein 14C-like [Physella acuta]XP_059159103.1 transmembrane protein 14C-like [Physella acuta]
MSFPLDLITAAYAATIAAGGIVGYVKAGSVPSLAMGVACGTLMMFGAFQMGQEPKNVTLSLVTSAVLTGVMGYRFSNSGKFMPAGLVGALSLLMVLRLTYKVMTN